MLRLILAGCALAAAAVIILLYLHSKNAVIAEIIADSKRSDAAAFAGRVDWPALRAFLKEDIAANKTGAGALGASIGPDLSQINGIVDYFVQPENIDVLFYQHESLFKDIPEEAFIDSTGFAPPFGFQMTLAWPNTGRQLEDVPPQLRERMKVRLIFRLDGLNWKIKEMHVPLFMVPHQSYGSPATLLFGRPPALPR